MLLLLLFVGFADFKSCLAGEKTVSQLKPGTAIRTTQEVNAPIPLLLGPVLNSDVTLVIQGGRAVPLFMHQASTEAACLMTDRTLELKDPEVFKLAKGSQFIVKRVELSQTRHPLFQGPMTEIEVEAAGSVGMKLKGKFQCFPGKPGKKPISIETFEEVFGRRIRVDSE